MGSVNLSWPLTQCVKYADDVTIIETIECTSQTLLSMSDIEEIFVSAGLRLNKNKCKEMIIPRSILYFPPPISADFVRVDILRILGFALTTNLSWEAQIKDVLKKASRRLYIIRCLRDSLCKNELISVYHAIITALFIYASPVYGNLSLVLLSKLNRFQKRAHRLICGRHCSCNMFDDISDTFLQCGLKLLLNCENPCHPLSTFVPNRLLYTRHFMLPVSHTARRSNSFFPWFCARSNELMCKY